MNTNISVILPVYKLDEKTKPLFDNAVKSVMEQSTRPDELILVVDVNDEESNSYIVNYDFGDFGKNVTIAYNNGETDFCSQVNLGVNGAKNEWVSILEQDDEYAKIYFKNVVLYRDAHPDVEIFMPIIVDVDANQQFTNFTNEAVWAQGFSDEMGILDNNALLMYQNFGIDGIVMKKSLFETFGGFKPSMKLTFIYEFLLRMTFKAVKTMVIPRLGYKHMNQREGSLFSSYKETINPVEARWWLAQAKKECYFTKDRNTAYTENSI